jgi:dienelactone hydrolase
VTAALMESVFLNHFRYRAQRNATSWLPARRALWTLRAAAVLALLVPGAAAHSDVIERMVELPISLQAAGGAPVAQNIAQNITVTIVREAADSRRPFMVLLHGRGGTAAERRAMGRQSYPANARYFASMGFIVLIPTRAGYGVSGGPDVEYTGTCTDKHFELGVAAAVSQTRQLLDYASRLPYVDPDRGIVLGESFGGLVAIAVAADDLPGVVAAINISGGDGGDTRLRPDHPCQPERLQATLALYGRNNRLPTLWMYSVNDRLWGPDYPKQWHAAFTRAGGRGQFVALPADKNNGHYIFNRNPPAWRPAFEAFVAQLGLEQTRRGN